MIDREDDAPDFETEIERRARRLKRKLKRIKRREADNPEVQAALRKEVEEELPDKGYARREVERMTRDELERLADESNKFIDGAVATPLGEIKLDNDIVRWMDGTGQLTISNARPDMEYCLIRRKTRVEDVDTAIEWMRRLGWEVVIGTDSEHPEAKEWLQVDGTRRVGDTILMRMPKWRYVQYRLMQKKDRIERHNPEALNARVVAVADKNPNVISVRTDMSSAEMEQFAKYGFARQAALNSFTNMLKSGSVPGRELK